MIKINTHIIFTNYTNFPRSLLYDRMAIFTDDDMSWVPVEIVCVIGDFLSLRDRLSYSLTCKSMKNALLGFGSQLYSTIWTTGEQKHLLRKIQTSTSEIIYLKAPPSTGKTLLSLWTMIAQP